MGGSIEPLLDATEIQGNVLGGFNKDHQAFIPFYFPQGSVETVHKWIFRLSAEVTWLPEVIGFKQTLQRALSAFGREPADLRAVWTSVAFSYPALRRLASDADEFDDVFRGGLPAATARLGDPNDNQSPGHVSNWLFGGPDSIPDGLLIVAADSLDDLKSQIDQHVNAARAAGIQCDHIEFGRDLAQWGMTPRFESGHEHFGFKDGVSQPGIRGRVAENPDVFLTPRGQNGSDDHALSQPEFSEPGKPLIFPGEFVLGYPRQSDTDARGSSPPWPLGGAQNSEKVAGPLWARNGSFLVYRRLRQNVPAFNAFLESECDRLKALPEFSALTPDQLGAMLVGRWRSGAPILRSTVGDNDALGRSRPANNAFGFLNATASADGFDPAVSDPLGTICPAAAHIRKVNPRDLPTDQGGATTSLVRRILRRGIPYGPPLPVGTTSTNEQSADRGLLFASYQASIRDQFEFISSMWANDESKPTPQFTPNSGHDMVIGQNRSDNRVRFCTIGVNREAVRALEITDFIVPTGGGYFFAPSKSALTDVLGRI